MATTSSPTDSAPVRDAGLAAPVTSLRGVGADLAARLARLDVTTVGDLFFLLPLRYEDRTRVQSIGALRAGVRAVVEGEVQLTEVAFRGRRTLLSRIADGTGSLTLRFFHFSRAQAAGLARGVRLRCFGEVRRGSAGLEMIHPEYRLIAPGAAPLDECLTPIYPATEGLQQGRLRRLTALALERLPALEELLPAEVRAPLDLPPLAEAVRYLHRPPPEASLEQLAAGRHPAQRRLAFEELLAQHLSLRQLRQRLQRERAAALSGNGRLRDRFVAGLGFTLTEAQRRVAAEIRADLARARPMLRLLQGDVGSGKTVVAALAALEAVDSGFQAAIMAPTELLAEQHFRTFDNWLRPLGLETAWLSGAQRGRARSAALEALSSGRAAVAVGTHALFQSGVRFARLALVIVDEQHRFGVHQRLALRDKGAGGDVLPHQLIMTATPIPRTLAMTAYADLDSSVLDELPPGRLPVRTAVLPETRRAEVVARVQRACTAGRQAYWVCPLIEESEALACEAAETTHAGLVAALPAFRVGLAHGRLPAREKERTMRAFKDGALDLLVATTVIEVGVDVPNASLMIVENAERMGLAQLHQLRGRVGRGAAQSDCVLLYRPPLSPLARERLSVLRESGDGFVIAERDLELRGPGEVLGTRQAGELALRVADVLRDQDLLPQVRSAAGLLLARHRQRIAPLVRRWVGAAARYGSV